MPNEKVKYFKPIEEIKDRIAYIKDKDVTGFDTANSFCFQYHLWNLSNFDVSDNIIYMDDDYFIGKPIKKSDFFYYDEEKKKVLPSIVSDQFKKLNKDYINREYNKFFSRKDKINPHTPDGWFLHTYIAYKLIFDNFPEPIINGGFTHNALSLNIHFLKEIYDFIKNKYEYSEIILNSLERTVYDIQFQTFYNTYVLNAKKGKVHSIKRKFYDLSQMRKKISFDYDLFVINTSGDKKYDNNDFQNLKNFLDNKFYIPTPYEIVNYKNGTINNTNNIIEKHKKSHYNTHLIIILIIIFIAIITLILRLGFYNIINYFKNAKYSSIRRFKKKHKFYKLEERYRLTNNNY